jgi:hypothetical protein
MNRIACLLTGIAIIAVVYLAIKFKQLSDTAFTKGVVTHVVTTHGINLTTSPLGGGTYDRAIVMYIIGDYEYRFKAPANLDYKKDDSVRVIYKISDPGDAAVYTFFGFWFNGILFCIIPIVPLLAVVFGFIGSDEKLMVSSQKPFLRLKKKCDADIVQK